MDQTSKRSASPQLAPAPFSTTAFSIATESAASLWTGRVCRIGLAVASLAIFIAAPSSSQTLEEVLAKHYEARGGLVKIKALDSLAIKGRLSTQGLDIPFTMQRKRPSFLRLEMEVQGLQILQAYDGEMAWGVNPMAGSTEVGPMGEAEARRMVKLASFDGALVDAQSLDAKLELAGREALGDGEAFRILVSYPDGDQHTIFIDAESYLEKKLLGTGASGGQEMEIEINFDEYKEVQGVQLVAKQTTSSPMGLIEMYFDEYEVDAEIDNEIFFLPGQEADESLTLDQILAKHVEARTKPAAAKIQTVRATGKITLMGFQVPLEMSFSRPSSTRLSVDLQGMEMVLAYDGETAWTVSPMQGIPEPEAMPDEAATAIALFSDFLWGLLEDHQSKGWELELAGIEKVDRDETYKVLVKTADGERELYLGGKDFLERKLHLEAVFLGSLQQIDALLSDYKAIQGLMIPHEIELLAGGVPQAAISIEDVEINVELDPSIFSLPPKPEPAAEPEPR